MFKKFFLGASIILFSTATFADEIPTPKPVIDCPETLKAWGNPPNCYCPCDTCEPVCKKPEKEEPKKEEQSFIKSSPVHRFIAYDSSYDSASGISGSSHRAAEEASHPENFDELNGPKENARTAAGSGFDTGRESNLGWGNQYIPPAPSPKFEDN